MRIVIECKLGDRVFFDENVVLEEFTIQSRTYGTVLGVKERLGSCTIEVTVDNEKRVVEFHDAIGPQSGTPSVRSFVVLNPHLSQPCTPPLSSEFFVWDAPDGDIKSFAHHGRVLREQAERKP